MIVEYAERGNLRDFLKNYRILKPDFHGYQNINEKFLRLTYLSLLSFGTSMFFFK